MIPSNPIPSHNLGKSLGLHVIVSNKPFSYKHMFCQIGNTANKSMTGQRFYGPEKMRVEVDEFNLYLEIKLSEQHTNQSYKCIWFVDLLLKFAIQQNKYAVDLLKNKYYSQNTVYKKAIEPISNLNYS